MLKFFNAQQPAQSKYWDIKPSGMGGMHASPKDHATPIISIQTNLRRSNIEISIKYEQSNPYERIATSSTLFTDIAKYFETIKAQDPFLDQPTIDALIDPIVPQSLLLAKQGRFVEALDSYRSAISTNIPAKELITYILNHPCFTATPETTNAFIPFCKQHQLYEQLQTIVDKMELLVEPSHQFLQLKFEAAFLSKQPQERIVALFQQLSGSVVETLTAEPDTFLALAELLYNLNQRVKSVEQHRFQP
ncbi:MAG: hypothetical protein KAT71_06205 [Gammaproteobacteria bacterium]|nr:hypothetical protein [Gammaproteobacteria bacterium]